MKEPKFSTFIRKDGTIFKIPFAFREGTIFYTDENGPVQRIDFGIGTDGRYYEAVEPVDAPELNARRTL